MNRLLTVVTVACVLSLAGPARGQSLGEVAKQNADAKAKSTKDGKAPPVAKTYTNKDLEAVKPVLPSTTAPVVTAPMPDPIPTPQSETSYRAEQVTRGEGYWKDRMRTLEAQATADTLALDAAITRLREYQTVVERSRVDINGVTLVSREYQRRALDARDEVSRLTAAARTDAVAIDNLQEEARRAGVPPGWLRTR